MIIKVLSNLKHNGTRHAPGDEFDLDEKYVEKLKGVVEPVEVEKGSKSSSKEESPQEVKLENKKRKALDKIAKSIGINNPEGLDSRKDVIEAIEETQEEDFPTDPDKEEDEDDEDDE